MVTLHREKVRFLLSNGFRRTSKGTWIANGLDTEGESDDDETDKEASTDGDYDSPNDDSAVVTNVTLGDSALGDMGTFFGLGAAEFGALSSAALEYYEVNSDTSEGE